MIDYDDEIPEPYFCNSTVWIADRTSDLWRCKRCGREMERMDFQQLMTVGVVGNGEWTSPNRSPHKRKAAE